MQQIEETGNCEYVWGIGGPVILVWKKFEQFIGD